MGFGGERTACRRRRDGPRPGSGAHLHGCTDVDLDLMAGWLMYRTVTTYTHSRLCADKRDTCCDTVWGVVVVSEVSYAYRWVRLATNAASSSLRTGGGDGDSGGPATAVRGGARQILKLGNSRVTFELA